MRIEISPRQYSVRLYEDDEATNYSASCQIFRYGDHCFIYSIIGRDFYKAFDQMLEWMVNEDFRSLEGYVAESHYRLLRRLLKDSGFSIEPVHTGDFDGHTLLWIKISKTV